MTYQLLTNAINSRFEPDSPWNLFQLLFEAIMWTNFERICRIFNYL